MKGIVGATVIDATGRAPLRDAVILVEGRRVLSVTRAAETRVPDRAEVIEAEGHYVIPGLMDSNVHLVNFLHVDETLEFEGRYSELVQEAAQIALRAGVTTVFDTWGPLDALTEVRDRINRGELAGARIFVAGNIVGLPGPISAEFLPNTGGLPSEIVDRINSYWEQGVGQELLWLPSDEVRQHVRDYIASSKIDFIKYAASGHAFATSSFIAFSERTQRAIVEEAERAGLTAQAHTSSVESLHMEIEAGAHLLQHPEHTCLEPIPEETIKAIIEKQLPCATLLMTEDYLDCSSRLVPEPRRTVEKIKDHNGRLLIEAGAKLLLMTDGFVVSPERRMHPQLAQFLKEASDFPGELGQSHFLWLEAAIQKGMAPMEALLSATRNVAEAYGLDAELGTLEPGKRADLLVLEADPLEDSTNYRRIARIMKDGEFVDCETLPESPVLTDRRSDSLNRAPTTTEGAAA